MAFKILNEDELSRLGEKGKAYYLKQLKKYREREAFVDRIEALDKVKLQKSKPKRPKIKLVDAPEVPVYRKRERQEVKLPKSAFGFSKDNENSRRAGDISGKLAESRHIVTVKKVKVPKKKSIADVHSEVKLSELPKISADAPKPANSSFSGYTVTGIGMPEIELPKTDRKYAVPEHKVTLPELDMPDIAEVKNTLKPAEISCAEVPKVSVPEIDFTADSIAGTLREAGKSLSTVKKSAAASDVKYSLPDITVEIPPNVTAMPLEVNVCIEVDPNVNIDRQPAVSVPDISFEPKEHKIEMTECPVVSPSAVRFAVTENVSRAEMPEINTVSAPKKVSFNAGSIKNTVKLPPKPVSVSPEMISFSRSSYTASMPEKLISVKLSEVSFTEKTYRAETASVKSISVPKDTEKNCTNALDTVLEQLRRQTV